MRVRTTFMFAIAAGTAAAVSSSGSSFAKTFWFLFWAAIVGVVLLLARFARASNTFPKAEMGELDPWVDANGVRHFPGDVFDIENHPRPGANGHL